MTKPLITIGIPTYNRANTFLPQVLASVTAQDYEDLEIVVSDNASSDDTPELMREYKDPRLRYVRQATNIGPEGNFNACLAEARGRYFLLLHDDDLIDSDFVSHCAAAMNASEEYGLIRTGTRVIDVAGATIVDSPNRCAGLSTADMYRAWFRGNTVFYFCSNVYHTDRLRRVGGFTSQFHLLQDNVVNAKLLKVSPRLDIGPVKATFRRHPGEITYSSSSVSSWCADYVLLHGLIEELCPDEADLATEGWRFFAHICFNLARSAPTASERLFAKLSVIRHFGWNSWVKGER